MRVAATAVAVLLAAGAVGQPGQRIDYRVTEVRGKLVRLEPPPETRLEVGDAARSGDLLHTGWRSSAEIEASGVGARFVLGRSTNVRLAGTAPGLLLEVDRGRLRAVFDALTGRQPVERVVRTPAAVLAVRGTEYGVDVERAGDTTVAVFSGKVAVTGRGGARSSVVVEPGYAVTIDRGMDVGRPYHHRMSPGDWDHGAMPHDMGGMGGRSGGHMGGHMGGGMGGMKGGRR